MRDARYRRRRPAAGSVWPIPCPTRQTLPGKWDSSHFNLPERLRAPLPRIAGQDTAVVMHNDAVVQGLRHIPWQDDVRRRGVPTIGTGLGHACCTNPARSLASPPRPADKSPKGSGTRTRCRTG
ncbi:MAG: hypothetical protein ACOYOH_13000 [Paracraurococcus sp.]